MLSRDIESAPPLPEFQRRQTPLQKVNSLIFWFVYFLLIWQATCHLSDNGMAWLLRFLVSWLKVLGIEISNDVFEKIILSFPGSLYLVRQFLNFDRDNFNKFVVCPKCTKLYKYDSCLTMVNNRQVAKTCSNTYRYIPDEDTNSYGNPIKVFKNKFQPGPCSFMPVQRIFSRSATAKFEQEGEKKIAASHIIRNVHL